MRKRVTRREMLCRGAGAGVGLWLAAGRLHAGAAVSDKLNIAFIGIGGRGRDNLNALSGQNVVALCDVDDERAGNAYSKFPWAKKYADYRVMLDDMEQQIDAVVVNTPDHTHFHPSLMALEMGKHLYLEKPLAHSVYEVRALTKLAREKKLATQLGAQRHTMDNMRRVVELIQSGAIGTVKECHAWVGGDRGMPAMPTAFPPVPPHLKWDLWLGPAAPRPYSPAYCPYHWRFWWDFGTGETGNWGCHILDIPYWALDLAHPTRVSSSGPSVHPQTTPKSMAVRYEFPSRGDKPPVTLHWYHTKSVPPIVEKLGLPRTGNNLFIGSEGMLLCDFGKRQLFPQEKFKDFKPPAKFIPDSPGFYNEWIQACKGGEPASCNFDYTGPMTEAVLLGNVAYRAATAFNWDAAALRPSAGGSKVQALLNATYAKGWAAPKV